MVRLYDEKEGNQVADEYDLYKTILKFYRLLEKTPDQPSSAFEILGFLRSFLRTKSTAPLPTIEVMTILKHEKPITYNSLRQMSSKNDLLKFLIDLPADLELAKERLHSITNKD